MCPKQPPFPFLISSFHYESPHSIFPTSHLFTRSERTKTIHTSQMILLYLVYPPTFTQTRGMPHCRAKARAQAWCEYRTAVKHMWCRWPQMGGGLTFKYRQRTDFFSLLVSSSSPYFYKGRRSPVRELYEIIPSLLTL